MDRRLPRSPALRSPVLSPKSPAIYENYKSGCAWRLIYLFNFRRVHSHGKLISDKKRINRQVKADGYARNRPNFLSNKARAQYIDDALDNKNNAANSRKPEVENFIEEEMSVKHQKKRNTAVNKRQNKHKVVGHSKDHRKANKSFRKSFPFPAHGCDAATDRCRQPSDENMVDKSSESNLALVTEASSNNVHTNNGGNYSCEGIRCRKFDHQTEINPRVQMDEAVEGFVDQKLNDGENLGRNEASNQSKNFIDALEILNSNKELFLKLLQDPNSLLVKHIQNLRDSQGQKQQPQSSSEAKTSQCQPKESGEPQGLAHAQMFESCDGCLPKRNDTPQPLSTMVVFKDVTRNCSDRTSNWPSEQFRYSSRKKKSDRPAFLSFEHMKRKLRHAMRANKREQSLMSLDDIQKYLHDFEQFKDGGKEMTGQANGRISASKSYQNVGKMSESSNKVNRRDAKGQTENFHFGIGNKATSSTESCQRISNLSTVRHLKGEFHPRKHLSDMLNRGNEDFPRKQTPRRLDSSMCLPEYDLLPTLTPGREKEYWFACPQMRFSPYSKFSAANGYKWRVQKKKEGGCLISPIKNLGAQPVSHKEKPDDPMPGAKKSISADISPATKVLQTFYCLGDDLSHTVNQDSLCSGKVVETNHAVRWDEHGNNALEITLEPHGLLNTNTNQGTEAVNEFGKSDYFACSKLNSPSRDQASSSIDVQSSSPLYIQRAEDSISMIDRAKQPSPISVLEQFFIEDNTSSPSSVSLPVTLELNGLQNTNTNQRTEAVNGIRESEYFECSKLNSPSSDQTSSSSVDVHSSSPLRFQKAEDSTSMIDISEQPSPVSVLEQFFLEDNTSSPSSVSLAAEPPVEPSLMDIEELYACSLMESHLNLKSDAGTSIDKQGSLSKCIRAVLQIAGLNWDELSRKWHFSDQMLDPSLFDNVEVWPERSCNDRRLLVGYISEVLLEIYQYYFGCSPWVSLLNPRPRMALLSKNMAHEVLRHVDWLLLSELPQQTLEQLVEKDLAKSGNWIDIQPDIEEVITELVDSILEDLVVNAAI